MVSIPPTYTDRPLTFSLEFDLGHAVLDQHGKLDPVLCPSFVYGFSMQGKLWCRFFIDELEDVLWKPAPMNSLLLPDRQKRILNALVSSHMFPDETREEAEQKGKGLVVLLHGSPGSGKTLTAGINRLCVVQNSFI